MGKWACSTLFINAYSNYTITYISSKVLAGWLYSWWTGINTAQHPILVTTGQTFTRLTSDNVSFGHKTVDILVAVGYVVSSSNFMIIDCYNDDYVEFLKHS